MAVIIGGIRQETNTFSCVPTTLESFKKGSLYFGDEIIEHTKGTTTGEGAFLDVLETEGYKVLPTVTARASSGGKVTEGTHRYLQEELLARIAGADNIEGVLLNMHGAMVSDNVSDTEGETFRKVRELVGPNVPIAVSLDGHAYITEEMLRYADVIAGYRTFPHVDEYQTGERAARMLVRILRGEMKPVMSAVSIPMLLPPHAQPDKDFPMKDILELCAKWQLAEGIEDVTFFPVQPWLDIPGTASTALVIGNADSDKSMLAAREIAQKAWNLKEEFRVDLLPPSEAVVRAKNENGVIALVESSDAPPAGAPGDGVALLRALLEEGFDEPAYVIVIDEEAVQTAKRVGRGNEVELSLGYHKDPRWGEPLAVRALVREIIEDAGYISKMTGMRVSMGETVLLQIGEVMVGVCPHAFSLTDPGVYEALGLFPEKARVLGVKSTLHFREFYKTVASKIYLLDTKGPSTSKFCDLKWEKITRPIWPLDEINWSAEDK